MGIAVHTLLEKNDPVTEYSLEIVDDVFRFIRNATVKHLRKYKLPLDMEKHTLRKVCIMKLLIFPRHLHLLILHDTHKVLENFQIYIINK